MLSLPSPTTPPPAPPTTGEAEEWLAPNPFQTWCCLQVADAAGELVKPSRFGLQNEVLCEVRCDGAVVEQFPLRVRDEGGEGGSFLSERVDVLLPREGVEMQLLLRSCVGKAALLGEARLDLEPLWAGEGHFDGWLPVRGGRGGGFRRRQSDEGTRPRRMLHVVARCFRAAALHESDARRAVFSRYAGGDALTLAEFEGLVLDLEASGRGREETSRAPEPRLDGVARSVAARPGCLATCLAWCGLFLPEVSMLRYLGHYHTLLWVACSAPGEQHVPVLHRCGFVLLSMCFNLLVVVVFTATDMSLTSLHCGDSAEGRGSERHDGVPLCSPLQRSMWSAAQVVLVALVDTVLWPVLKAIFLFFYDHRYSQRKELRRWVRIVNVGLVGATTLWTLASAFRHWEELGAVLTEFLSTWPAARVTEAFRLMALWGLLVEYGMPDKSVFDACAAPDGAQERAPPPSAAKQDSKRVPLLSAQH